MKKAIWLSAGLICVIVIVAVMGWSWWQAQQAPETKSSSGGSVSLGTHAPAGNEEALEMTGQSLTPPAGSGTSGTGSSAGSPTPLPASLPGPAEFGQYEQYKQQEAAMFIDIEQGTGAAVGTGSNMVVDYQGWLTNGKLFDSSYVRKQRYSFNMQSGVIAGWKQGIWGMKAGGKRRLIIPPKAGYGDQANGTIPANSVLVFDIWLHEVK
jgi:hypothetical protein